MGSRAGRSTEDMVDGGGVRSGTGAERVQLEKRYIYSGETRQGVAGYAIRPNKRGVRRKVSTFNIILILFGAGITIVLYVSNILAVNQLAFDANKLRMKYDSIINVNGALRAEVNRKSALEQIGPVVTGELKLRYPVEQAVIFDVDRRKIEELKEE